MARKPAASQAEIEQRVYQVAELLIAGAPRHHIHAVCAQKFDVSARQADRYIEQAAAEIAAEAAPQRAALINTTRARLERLYYKAATAGDLRSALAALKQLADLYGLNAPTRSAVDLRVDTVEVQTVIDAIERTGLPPSLVFNQMLAAIARMSEGEGGHE